MFQVEHVGALRSASTKKRRILPRAEHFWLCDDCAAVFTLAFVNEAGVTVIPLRPARHHQGESRIGTQAAIENRDAV